MVVLADLISETRVASTMSPSLCSVMMKRSKGTEDEKSTLSG